MLKKLKCRKCGTEFLAEPEYKGLPCPKCHVFDDADILPGPVLPLGIIEYRHGRIYHTEMDWDDLEE